MFNEVDLATVSKDHFDVVVIGSGFGSAFFVQRHLANNPKARVLILELGQHNPVDWQVANKQNTPLEDDDSYRNEGEKPWTFTLGLGGGMNCWYAHTPRLHPNDFRMQTAYGRGLDWPISYDDLEPYYCDAEDFMSISGDPDIARVTPRSRPFPQPPHRMQTPDEVMKRAMPDFHFTLPTARARVATESRNACCATLRCNICPANAKFNADNGMLPTFQHERVTMGFNCKVTHLVTDNNVVRSVHFEHGGKDYQVSGDLVVLGANSIHSPAILLRSGMGGRWTGLGIVECHGTGVEVLLDGMDAMNGSTITTGLNYKFYDGPHRKDYSAALIYFDSRYTSFGLRTEKGRWQQSLPLTIVTEDLLYDHNKVTVDGNGFPVVNFAGFSDYATVAQSKAFEGLDELLKPLPVEKIIFRGVRGTESHIQSTLRMGTTAENSEVDHSLMHHKYRNLLVVGSSVFSSCSCANPSLTVAALSMRAADLIAGKTHEV